MVPWVARDAKSKLADRGGRGLLLDCGANVGGGFSFFRTHFTSDLFDYHLFEPNPSCIPVLERIKKELTDHNMTIHPCAVGAEDGVVRLYGLKESDDGTFPQGASTLAEHNSAFYKSDPDLAIDVRQMDFVKVLEGACRDYKVVVVKMDVEGAEYGILERLLQNGLPSSLHSIFCEFHSRYMADDKGRAHYEDLERKIKSGFSRSSCAFLPWG